MPLPPAITYGIPSIGFFLPGRPKELTTREPFSWVRFFPNLPTSPYLNLNHNFHQRLKSNTINHHNTASTVATGPNHFTQSKTLDFYCLTEAPNPRLPTHNSPSSGSLSFISPLGFTATLFLSGHSTRNTTSSD